ncbi:MAG TPA: metalloregulator ArsR/SmtB family transcription factor [Acidobacteriota bacterium]|nr:metalloregulator ArsR/SmtB family transcription factor [Acidobacteriota bacterium]
MKKANTNYMLQQANTLRGDKALELVARRFRVLGEPMRLKLLRALQNGETNVTELVSITKSTQANVSRHLSVLLNEGVVFRRKEGLNVIYRIQDPSVFRLCELVCGGIEKQLHTQTKAITGS